MERSSSQSYVAVAVGGGFAALAVSLLVFAIIYIKRNKYEGWFTRKLQQMGVVKSAKCHAENHGEDGDGESIEPSESNTGDNLKIRKLHMI